MWPFKKKKNNPPRQILYTQLDITEGFADDQGLTSEDWIRTETLNEMTDEPEAMGLPAKGANQDEVYEIASKLSEIRESINPAGDGVYCPVCHIANVNLDLLRQPCPKCGRELLQFGWD